MVSYCRPFLSDVCNLFAFSFLKMHGRILTIGQDSFLGVYIGDSKLFKLVHVASMGPQGEGPQRPKLCKFHSPDPEVEQSSYLLCRSFLGEE